MIPAEVVLSLIRDANKPLNLQALLRKHFSSEPFILENIPFCALGNELREVDFSGCTLKNCDFAYTKLVDCSLEKDQTENCNFEGVLIETSHHSTEVGSIFGLFHTSTNKAQKEQWLLHMWQIYPQLLFKEENLLGYCAECILPYEVFQPDAGDFINFDNPEELIKEEDEPHEYTGWKLHINVSLEENPENSLKKLIEVASPILAKNNMKFKIVHSGVAKEAEFKGHVFEDSQITIYLTKDTKPRVSPELLSTILHEITEACRHAALLPGTKPESDVATVSEYVSMRYDRGDLFETFFRETPGVRLSTDVNRNYIPADVIGAQYNPPGADNPFAIILAIPENPSFNFIEHFKTFRATTDKNIVFAIQMTLVAYLRKNTCIDLLSPQQGREEITKTVMDWLKNEHVRTSFLKDASHAPLIESIVMCISILEYLINPEYLEVNLRALKNEGVARFYSKNDEFYLLLKEFDKVLSQMPVSANCSDSAQTFKDFQKMMIRHIHEDYSDSDDESNDSQSRLCF